MSLDVSKHVLVPKHTKLGEKEKKELLERHNISAVQLPRIYADDPAITHLDVQEGDIVKIARKSPTAGDIFYYRQVVAA